MMHLMVLRGTADGETSYETDRLKFVGRGGTLADPAAFRQAGKLSNTEGPVLDPIVAIRHRVTIEPDESVIVDIVPGVSVDDCVRRLVLDNEDRATPQSGL